MKKIFAKFLVIILTMATVLSTGSSILHAQNTDTKITTVEMTEEDYKAIATGKYQTYTIDENGNIIPYYPPRSVGTVIKKILIWLGKQLVDVVYGIVIDGVVQGITGKSIEGWLTTEIQLKVIGKPYTQNVHINWGPFTCPGVVIDHSGRCN